MYKIDGRGGAWGGSKSFTKTDPRSMCKIDRRVGGGPKMVY